MNFDYSDRTRQYVEHARAFLDEHLSPNEKRHAAQVDTGQRCYNRHLRPAARCTAGQPFLR